MTLRLVQLGLGGWGRNWVEEVTRATPGVLPVAWVDLDPATRERAISELDLPPERVFGSLAEALQAVDADAALAAVPLAVHGQRRARRSRPGCTSWWRSPSPTTSPRRRP